MCDTIVALGNMTVDGRVLFAKNSDREPNEAHEVLALPRTLYAKGSWVKCTYIELPQVRETYAVLLSKPFWMWGCEMGVNEHGVAIGNEAVFAKEPYPKQGRLLGMDMIRLALERTATARSALELITDLLADPGQGGPCGFHHKLYYHNAFIIADPTEAWVLETAGRYWAAIRVTDFYAISNGLTIGADFDLAAPGLVDHAIARGWCSSEADFHFSRCYGQHLLDPFVCCVTRQSRSAALLRENAGQITLETLMALLRDHGPQAGEDLPWQPAPANPSTLCMHAGFGPTRTSQSVGSLVARLDPDLISAWVTATSAPCTGIFKPLWMEAGTPDLGPQPQGTYDPHSLWWRHERLHRAVLADYGPRSSVYRAERDVLEAEFLAAARDLERNLRDAPSEQRRAALLAFSADCFARADEATARWTAAVRALPVTRSLPLFYQRTWRGFNRQAKLPLSE